MLRRVHQILGNRSLGRALALAFLALLGLGLYTVVVEPSRLVVNRSELEIPNWPRALSGTKVALRSAKATLDLAPPNVPLLALVHEPDIFAKMDARASLTLAGHTHGGQVWLPFLGRPIVPSAFGQRYAAGHVVENGRHLFVTTGLGTSIYPVRFRVPPEITLLTLRAQPGGQ